MIQFVCTTRLPSCLSKADLERIAYVVSHGLRIRRPTEVALRLVSLKEIQRLNHQFRHKDRPTDVLSFSVGHELPLPEATERFAPTLLGDLVICSAFARAEAERRGIEPREELVRLVIHGVLHLCGYDHATLKDEEQMFARQEAWVENVCK